MIVRVLLLVGLLAVCLMFAAAAWPSRRSRRWAKRRGGDIDLTGSRIESRDRW